MAVPRPTHFSSTQWWLIREGLWQWSKGHCWYCGTESPSQRTIDHVDAFGADELENYLPACGRCNGAKGWMSLEEFRRWKAEDVAAWPSFTRLQMEWLRKNAELPALPRYEFFGERTGLGKPGKPKEHPGSKIPTRPSNDFRGLPTNFPTTSDETEKP